VTQPGEAAAVAQRTSINPEALSPQGVLQLQRTAGNRAVARLVAGGRTVIQPKLTVGAADDPYEREADRVAAQVMSAKEMSHSAPSVARAEQDDERAQRVTAAPSITPLVRRSTQAQDLRGSFDAGHDVESLLDSTRSGGNPLPGGTRSFMESRIGADFGGVRVHSDTQSDQLNRKIGAQAFTHGRHIYMAAGKFNPGTGGGKQLLAHELTHVVQQTGGTSTKALRKPGLAGMISRQVGSSAPAGVIQRAIGFEFETGYKIEKKQGNQWVNLKKMDVVKDYGDGMKLTADENSAGFSAIEMVLDPPVQETEPAKFTKALKTFKKVSAAFHALKPGKDVNNLTATPLNKVRGASGPSKYQVTPTFSGFLGNPQLTGGIRYDKLFEFLEEAAKKSSDHLNTDPHKLAKEELTNYKEHAKDVTALTGAKAEVNKINGSAELKGLVAMLGMYLNSGAGGQPMFNYAKLISNSFMARTDFGSMFAKLPPNEKARYVNDRESFATLVLEAAGMSGEGDKKVFERGIRKSDNKTSPDYNVDVTNDGTLGMNIKRKKWLVEISKGYDPISSHYMPHLKDILMGLGALGTRTDRVGNDPKPAKGARDKGRGIIVELRNMKGFQTPQEFSDKAQAIFDYIVALNA
jgi:hypothetical protein